jgi:phosphatidate phosphatase APP1
MWRGANSSEGSRSGGNRDVVTAGLYSMAPTAATRRFPPFAAEPPGSAGILSSLRVLLVALSVLLATDVVRADSPIKDDESVVLFNTCAQADGDGWLVPVHGWIFEPEAGSTWRRGALLAAHEAMDLDDSPARSARFEAVARWFLVDNERGKRLPITVGGVQVTLPRSGSDGHVRQWVRLPASGGAEWLDVETRARDGRRFRGLVQLVPRSGVSVISDVDDTIKVTEVLAGKRRILERTFLEPFEEVPGMAARYRAWRDDGGAVFHYVSASPWHLYPELSRFMDRKKFPTGTLHLRQFRVKDERRWNLLASPRRHKLREITTLLSRYPKRRFVLVGDTGESDPEIYGEVARAHPKQIAAIAIRRLPGDTWTSTRRTAAFTGVKARIAMFSSPAELPDLAELARP